MGSCCFIGDKYIDIDGKIDFIRYNKSIKEYIDYILFVVDKYYPEGARKIKIPEITFDPNKICKCDCHKDDVFYVH